MGVFRLTFHAVQGLSKPRLSPLEPAILGLTVWPYELDFNGHMNNSRYLAVMDLGRFDWMLRTGTGHLMWRSRWRPLVGAAMLRFRRSLEPFARYALHTRLLGWDEKWLYMEQRFVQDGQAAASAVVQALFRSPQGNVPPAQVLEKTGHASVRAPTLPEHVRQWAEAVRDVR